MCKIVVMTDVHANLPALQAALDAIQAEGYDAIYHTGDAVAIGPQPTECLDLLLATPRMHFVMGNHDAWLAFGLPRPQPYWMSDGEMAHQRWVAEMVDPARKQIVAQWPFWLEAEFAGVRTAFVHYGLARNVRDFVPIYRNPTIHELDEMFEQHHAQLLFYGHHHPYSDREGRARYVNPGSLGCDREAIARYAVTTFAAGEYTLEHRAVAYDDAELRTAFAARQVPERDLLWRIFFGDR